MTREEFRDYVDFLRSQDEISYDVYCGLIDGIDTLEQEPKTEKVIKMRDATPEENEAINKYIKSISKPTGVNFWDLADGEYISRQQVRSEYADWYGYGYQDNWFYKRLGSMSSVAIPPEHDGCKDCKYATYPEYYYPCCDCKQNYIDKWERAKHWIHRNDDYNDWLECPNCGYGSEGEVKYGEGTPFCPYCGERLEEK